MTGNIRRKPSSRNRDPLPLFDWAESQRRLYARPTAAERMLRRLGHTPSSAKLYASLAGYNVQGDE